MAFTVTIDNMTGNNTTFNARAADGIKMIAGSWGVGAISGTISGHGTNIDFTGLATIAFCIAEINTYASSLIANYNYSKAAIDIFVASNTDTGCFLLMVSDSFCTGIGGYFMAMGPPD